MLEQLSLNSNYENILTTSLMLSWLKALYRNTIRTLGVNMWRMPSIEPFKKSALIRKHISTTYGNRELKYMICKEKEKKNWWDTLTTLFFIV